MTMRRFVRFSEIHLTVYLKSNSFYEILETELCKTTDKIIS